SRLREYESICALSSTSVEAEALRPTGPAEAAAPAPISNLSLSRFSTPSLFIITNTKSTACPPICNPKLPPPIEKKAGLPHEPPPSRRQLIKPLPNCPPKTKPPFLTEGKTATHFARSRISSGI